VLQINSISQNTKISRLILEKLEEVANDQYVRKFIEGILEVERNSYTKKMKSEKYEKILEEVLKSQNVY